MSDARRPGLRSQSRLNIPANDHGLGRGSRSPSPAARPGNGVFFGHDHPHDLEQQEQQPDAMETPEETIRRLTAALSSLSTSNKKPDLPDFDKKNIDIWIKRIEAAFTRSSITEPSRKFAFLEAKITVEEDPRINEFLFGPATEARWTAFLAYLRKRHGLSKQQQAAVVLDGVKRDGRTPSELFSILKEKVGDITVDEILKEMVIRELPTDIQRTIWDKSDTMSGIEAAELADSYFDKDGRPIHKTAQSSINEIDRVPGLLDTTDDEADVNAVGGRPRQRKPFPRRQPRPTTQAPSQHTQGYNGAGNSTNNGAFGNSNAFSKPFNGKDDRKEPSGKKFSLCHFHQRYGDAAFTCLPGCLLNKPNNGYNPKKNPNAVAPRRA